MLRLGVALASKGLVRPFAHAPVSAFAPTITLSTRLGVLSSPFQLSPVRTYVVKPGKQTQTSKKQKLAKTVKIAKMRIKSGTRLKRVYWLDTPRVKKTPRPRLKKTVLLQRLNTEENIKRHVEKIKAKIARGALPYEYWCRTLLHQIRCSPEHGATLTDYLLTHPKKLGKLHEETYIQLLAFWYRRKNVDRVNEVWAKIKEHKKETDKTYSLVCKALSTRGQLAKAKELMEEREARSDLIGTETLSIMLNYVAADNLDEGIKVFERLRERLKASETPKDPSPQHYSTIIGWCLKHQNLPAADKYLEERKDVYIKENYSVPKDETEYQVMLEASKNRDLERKKMWSDYENVCAEAEYNGELHRLKSKGDIKKPKLPPRLPMPRRWSVAEFLEQKPVTYTAHLIRPLLDLVEHGKPVPRAKEIGRGLKKNTTFKEIYGLAQILDRGKSPRLETLRELLKILKLPKNIGHPKYKQGRLPPPPVKPPKKKEIVIKKWWKKPLPKKETA